MRHPKFYRDAGRLPNDENVFDDFLEPGGTCGCVNSSQQSLGRQFWHLQRVSTVTFTGCAGTTWQNVAQTLGSPAPVQADVIYSWHMAKPHLSASVQEDSSVRLPSLTRR